MTKDGKQHATVTDILTVELADFLAAVADVFAPPPPPEGEENMKAWDERLFSPDGVH